ncbi:MAG: hypothetical protein AAGC74_03545 [Verrucomicrobiota bacterium]
MAGEAPVEKKGVEAFYPLLLGLSTILTGVFLWMYVTKPVVVRQMPESSQEEAGAMVMVKQDVNESSVADLQPWPEEDRLPGELSGAAELARVAPVLSQSMLEPTQLRMQHIFLVDSGESPHERVELEVPVYYESRTLAWTPERIQEARLLAGEMAAYLEAVRQVREQGESLAARWELLVSESMPLEVLPPDSPSRSENHRGAVSSRHNMAGTIIEDTDS